MVYARLSDITGRKAALLTGVCIFTISSLVCGLAHTVTQLYVSPMSVMLRHRLPMHGEHHNLVQTGSGSAVSLVCKHLEPRSDDNE
jgi:MFS family permease